MRKVRVGFIWNGKKDWVEPGVLIGDKVLTEGDGSYSIHKFVEVDEDGDYIVAENSKDYLAGNVHFLFDLLVQHSNSSFQWISAK